MKKNTILVTILAGLAAFVGFTASATPAIVSPADYATVSTMTEKFKGYLDDPKFTTEYFNYSDYGQPDSKRVAQRYESYSNSAPVTVSWSGSSGTCTVKLWRTHKDSASNPVFTKTTTGTSVSFYDLEIGRNYTWSVTDGNGTATGHFYTLRNAPRMINSQNPDTPGAECSNGRDMGGRLTADGTKAIRQGLIFRTAQLEYCNPRDTTTGVYGEMQWLKNTLGVKLDVDLRDKSHLLENYVGTGQGTNDNPARAYCGEYNFRYTWKNNSILTSINESSIGEGITRFCVSATTGKTFPSWEGFFSTDANKKAVWYAFDAIYESVKKGEPLVFHCSHGKDRGGTLAFVLHGVLGVTKAEAIKDFGISWFDNPDETLNFNTITTKIVNKLAEYTGDTLQQQCAAYLAQCGQKYGLTLSAAQEKVADFQALMLEDIEAADGGDTFAYTDYYWRRSSSGGTWSSSTGYWYKNSSGSTKYPGGTDPNAYQNRCFWWPTASLPYARPVCGYKRAGKLVTVCANAASDAPAGPYNLKAYFSTEGHTMADRAIIEHRSGVGDYENVDLYFTTYDESKLGENNLGAAYVYSGTAAIEIWANATMRVRDIRDMSQKHKSSVQYKAYVKFPENNCDNARFEALDTDTGDVNLLGWFTGGQAGTTQHLKVGGTILQFNATGKTSGVDGALVLEFELGSANTTSSAAMLKIAGTLKANAGSLIVVDAGGKGTGTYKLVQAGTLTDNANLPANATVTNCKSGYYGTVVRSGNNLNLVIAAGTPPSTDIAITASAAYVTYPSPKFTVSGTVAVGEGTTTATLHYALNGGAEQTQALTLASGGSFSAEIPYAAAGDTLVWHVTAQNVNGGVTTAGSTASTTTSRATDSAATTYVWTGAAGDGKWTTLGNWTNTSATAYGYPANGTYATAEFPDSMTGAFTCTVDQNVAVKSLYVYSPNIRLVLDDKTLTVNGTSGSYTSYSFGNSIDGNPSIELVGAGAAVVSAARTVRANYGYITDEGGANGVCTVKYVVPASGWTTTAPVRATDSDSKVLFYPNARLVVDATALGVPAEGVTKTVYLASGTDAPGVYQEGTCVVTCAPGARGSVAVSDNKLVLSVTASGEPVTTTEIDPPTMDIPSGSAFTANGAVQKPAVSPATAAGYTVDWGATDWTSAGTHTLTITPNYGYAWTGGSTAPITYTYTFSTITYTPYYFGKSNNLSGRYQSSSKWYTSSAYTTAIAYPDAYTAHNVATVPAGSSGSLVMDGQLVAKAGKFTANGTFTLGYGTLQFQNNTVTPVPLWTTESGVSRIKSQNIELSGIGTGYFDIHANASNVLSTVTASAGVFVRFNTSNAAGATLVVDSEDSAGLTTLGWFEGGTAATTPRLVADGACVSFAKADAVSGVAGPLAIAVTLGEHNTNATPISVAGTLNVNAGSTLAVNASSLPAGTYAILSAGTLNDMANLAASGVVTGLGEGLVGTFVRSENAIRLVISPEAPDDPDPVLTEIAIPAARTGLVYDGAEKTGVLPGTGYTLADNVETGAGDYTATATLDEGYCWTGALTDPAAIAWSIAKAQNAWTAEPAITKATWAVDGEAGVLTPAATQFGAPSATIAKDGGAADAFAGTLPTAVGSYVITFTSDATANWLAPTPAAKTLAFSIVAPDPGTFAVTLFDEHPEWGYKVEGLGVAHDETALVFTNQNASSMAWTVPADLADVQFLVVGGGGGGGADYNPGSGSAPFLGGGGGGGGGVVTGVVSTVVADTEFSIKVGAGGAGGICNKTQVNGGFGASYAGLDSTVSLGGVAVLTAFGGGNDKGTTSSSAKSGRVGGTGGSNAGSRGGYGTAQGSPTRGSVAASFASQLAGYGVLGNVGGSGNTGEQYWGYYSASGGGGGATTAGGTPNDYSTGGNGGEGLASDITGTLRVYGSGGGGGTISGNLGGAGGTGAGSGNIDTGNGGSGQDALANQGGGGGGGGRSGNGGKGGSGIVVLRFRVPSAAPAMPSVSGEDVAPAEVFTKAREAKSIVYPSEPTVTGDVGSQVISFGGVDVNVPDYYTASKSGNVVTLALNDNAKPVITDEDETPGIAIVDGKVHIHLGNVKSALYYTILTATSLDSGDWTSCGAAEQGQDDFEFNATGATRFYKASVRDEAE